MELRVGPVVAEAWLDSQGRPVLLRYPTMDLEVIRQGPLFARLAEGIPRATRVASLQQTGDSGSGSKPRRDTASSRTETVSIARGGFTLAGQLLLPPGTPPYPAAVLISGSGQQDRDGYAAALGMPDYRPLRDMATVFVHAGVAVLRIDDRGVGASGGGETLDSFTTSTVAEDVEAQIRFLRERAEVDPERIALIGHSEGALVAMMVAARDRRVAGLGLLTPMATRGDTLLQEQLEDYLATAFPALTAATKDSARLAQTQRFTELRHRPLPDEPGVAWLRTFIDLEPAPFAARISQPVLILHGARDHQVRPIHTATLAHLLRGNGNRDVGVHVVEGVNHLLLSAPTGAVMEYASLKRQTLPPEVLSPLVAWLVRCLQ